MFQKDARWGEGWAGLIYRGTDSRGRSVRIIPLRHVSSENA